MKLKALYINLMLLVTTTAGAQQKIGFVYVDSLLAVMPETKQADSLFQGEQQKWQKLLTDKEEEIRAIADSMTRNIGHNSLNEKEFNRLKDFYNQKLKEYADCQQKAQDSLEKYSEYVYGRVESILNKLIADVAKEKAFITVLDASNELVLYFDNRYNLTGEVRKKLIASEK